MATPKTEVKPTPVKRVGTAAEKKPQPKVAETKKIEAVSKSKAAGKPEAKAEVKKAEEKKKSASANNQPPVKEARTAAAAKKEPVKTLEKPAESTAAKAQAKKAPVKRVDTTKPVVASAPQLKSAGKTVYHVTKREKDGREWKVFIQGSDKVIKLFPTQAAALEYARGLCANKNDGSYVLLHGLDGKIRKY